MTEADGAEDQDAGIRASDTERARAAHRLTEAVGEGRLTLEEFTQRVGSAYASTTRDELGALTADLPSRMDSAENDPERIKRRWRVAILGGSDYTGRWRVPAKTGFFALMGGSKIDLREATLASQEIEITLVSIMGGSDVLVPRGIRVEVDATNVLGGDEVKIDESAVMPDSPTVHVRTYSLMGGNNIRHPKKGKRGRKQ